MNKTISGLNIALKLSLEQNKGTGCCKRQTLNIIKSGTHAQLADSIKDTKNDKRLHLVHLSAVTQNEFFNTTSKKLKKTSR